MNATEGFSLMKDLANLSIQVLSAKLDQERATHAVELAQRDARIAHLEALLGEAPHSEDCESMASGWVAGLEVAPGDLDCNCFKAGVRG